MMLDSTPQEDDDIIVLEVKEQTDIKHEAISNHRKVIEQPQSSGEDQHLPAFIVDTQGTEPVHTGLAPPRLRSIPPPRATSPTPSDSSEEVILFAGRNHTGEVISKNPDVTRLEQKFSSITVIEDESYKQSFTEMDVKMKDIDNLIHEQEELLESVFHHKSSSNKSNGKAPAMKKGLKTVKRLPTPKLKGIQKSKKTSDDDDDAWIADYIANMDKDDDDSAFEKYNQRELGGSDDGIWQETETSGGEVPSKSKSGWSREDIDDFDELSTSDGERGDVQAILSKRERASGVQYLVVWEDTEVDEARWVPLKTLVSKSAVSHVGSFEAEERLVAEFADNGEDDISASDESDVDGSSDEVEKPLRSIPRMSDAKIARLLTKQEELGMGSDELLLFDDEEDVEEVPSIFASAIAFTSPKQRNTRGSKRTRTEFPSATLVADAFDGFDVMDFDRPSLRRKPKGRRGKPVLDLSDSELEAAMQMAWENDRFNKAAKKKEREDLRGQGLLGSKTGKPDLKQKYQEGMGIHAVKEEIKIFLMGSISSLSLPPMDKADRKVVHEIANMFHLKSKSAGNGSKRFPILYRTARTTRCSERDFDAVEARLSRRFLPRMDVGGKGKRPARGVGGFSNAAVSYRDGDVVGGSAPELGADNKGRAMLEKMGWSSGTALGALNNKGILQPVSHVVKTTKAGLG